MERKQMYTALSRTTKLEYVRIDKPARYYCKPKEYPSVVANSYFNYDFHNGQVYEISFELIDKLYVGCSTRNLQQRLDEHINDKKSPVFKYRNMKPTIRPIICCPCKDRKELNKVEAEHIMRSSMVTDYSTNNMCLNYNQYRRFIMLKLRMNNSYDKDYARSLAITLQGFSKFHLISFHLISSPFIFVCSLSSLRANQHSYAPRSAY